jgi:hypothetical protein
VGAGLPARADRAGASAVSLQPMAARLGLRSHDPLHHFVISTTWDDRPLRRVLPRRRAYWWAALLPSWSSMIRPCPGKASTRGV